MALLFPAGHQEIAANGVNSAGDLYIYANNTTTAANIYSDPELTTSLTNPVQLDSQGRSPTNIYVSDGVRFTVVVTTTGVTDIWGTYIAGGTIWTRNDVWGWQQQANGTFLTPIDNYKLPGATNDSAAFQAAISALGYAYLLPGNTYTLPGAVTITADDIRILAKGALINYGADLSAGDDFITFQDCNRGSVWGGDWRAQVRATTFAVKPATASMNDFDFSDFRTLDHFYAINTGVQGGAYPTNNIRVNNVRAIGANGSNSGAFIFDNGSYFNVSGCYARYAENASAYGFRACSNIVCVGNTERSNADASTSDASIQIEDCPTANAVISGNSVSHDIWIDESSNVQVGPNFANRLRITVTDTSCADINCSGGSYTGINIDDIGTVVGTPTVSASFSGMKLDPARDTQTSCLFMTGSRVGKVRFSDIELVSNGSSNDLSITRNAANDIAFDNVDFNGGTLSITGTAATGTLKFRNCTDVTTRNRGTATITSGGTSIAVTHGIDAYNKASPALGDINIVAGENPTNAPGHIWVDTITATQFTINCAADPGASNLDFGWGVNVED